MSAFRPRSSTARAGRGRRLMAGSVAGSGLLAAALVAATVTGPGVTPGAAADGTTPTTTSSSTPTSTVTKRDLVARESVDGTLGYGDSTAIAAGRAGTVTALPEVGAIVERGQSLLTVDDRTLPLLYGTVPLWRSLSAAVTDGPDVAQLEENLVALGYTSDLAFTVDQHFDAATAVAVQRWQKALGITETAIIEKGDFAVAPGAVRVEERKVAIGDPGQPGAPALSVTGTDRTIKVRLDVANQTLAHEGDAVQVVLPDDTTVPGRITKVGKVATKDPSSDPSGQSGPAKIDVVVALDDPTAVTKAGLDEAPVTVKLTSTTAKGVLTVPVSALLSLREGGYAVEVVRNGSRSLVGVKLGASEDNAVQVTGEVHEGDKVVVAS